MINRFTSHNIRIAKTTLFKRVFHGHFTHISLWSLNPLDDFQDSEVFDNFRCRLINWVNTSDNVPNQQLPILMFKFFWLGQHRKAAILTWYSLEEIPVLCFLNLLEEYRDESLLCLRKAKHFYHQRSFFIQHLQDFLHYFSCHPSFSISKIMDSMWAIDVF